MTLEEAFRELGIDASAPPEAARRAYLRRIKTRKPETDPEGFRRLREAYEVVTGALAEPQMEQGPEDEEEAEAPPELAALAARLRDLPAETRLEERLAVLREAVREHPRSLGVRWWLIQELGRAGRDQEALDELFQGDEDGLPGFLESRAHRFPGSVGPEDLARLEASGSPEILAIAARVHLKGSRYGEAAAVLGRALDRIAEWENPALHPVPEGLPRGILALEAAGRSVRARALHDRLWSWLSGTGDAALLQRWGANYFWRVVHELGLLDPAFPAELLRAAAAAAVSGEAGRAVKAAKSLAEKDPDEAERAAALLYDLPILYGLYFRFLHEVGPGQTPRVVREKSPLAQFISALAFVLVGLLLTYRLDSPPVPTVAEARAAMHGQAKAAWNGLEAACNPQDRKVPQKACDAAFLAVERAREDNCTGARAALAGLDANLSDLGALDLTGPRVFQSQMLSALSAGCRDNQSP